MARPILTMFLTKREDETGPEIADNLFSYKTPGGQQENNLRINYFEEPNTNPTVCKLKRGGAKRKDSVL